MTDDTRMTLAARLAQASLTMTARSGRTDGNAADWRADASHWTVTLHNEDNGESMEVGYSQGSAWNGAAPELANVLECLLSDAAGIDNAPTFEEWAGEYGYDTDSRKAERAYLAAREQTAELATVLGDAYDDYLWNTDRD